MSIYLRSLAVLGLNESASVNDIKSAYRRKAKALHPDINPSPRAKEDFLKLKRAYEHAILHKTNPTQAYRKTSINSKPETAAAYQKRYGTHKNWNSQANQEARAKAREEAERKNAEYLKSDEYKDAIVLGRFFTYVALLLVVVMTAAMLILPLSLGMKGLFFVPILFVLAFPLWWAYVKNHYRSLSFEDFKVSLNLARKTYLFWIVAFTATNLFLFFYFTVSTVISSNLILSLFGLLILSTKLLTNYILDFRVLKQNYWAVGVVPFALNLLFLINYCISFNPVSETLSYQFTPYDGERSSLQDGLIFHPEQKYANMYFIRMHFSPEVRNSSKVTYTTATGLLGLPVLTNAEFSGVR
ncbi:MAG: J domain-containing protein [Flavobacteriales bacterium]